MKGLLFKRHYCYKIHTLIMKSSANTSSIDPPFYIDCPSDFCKEIVNPLNNLVPSASFRYKMLWWRGCPLKWFFKISTPATPLIKGGSHYEEYGQAEININCTKKMKFSIKDFFSKGDQIRRKLRIPSHLLKKSLTSFVTKTIHKKWSLPSRIYSVNVTKSAGKSADLVSYTEEIRNEKLHFVRRSD